MSSYFFYGMMIHPPLREAVLGRRMTGEPAMLPRHRLCRVKGEQFPMLVADPHDEVPGLLVEGLGLTDVSRLDFFHGRFAVDTLDVQRPTGAMVAARAFVLPTWQFEADGPWSVSEWVAVWGDLTVIAAQDIMAIHGQRDPDEVLRRMPQLLVRAGSRIRARRTAPTALRQFSCAQDVEVADRREPYANFFTVEEYDLVHRRFDGSRSKMVNRAVFVSGDAATVLPYDPLRDRVLLIEQFRVGPYARGDAQPWMLEPVAGRVDPGETPEGAARREALEEAGVPIGALLEVAQYYPTPGAKTEYLYTYVGLADLPDGAAGIGGLEDEGEDIRSHIISFDDLMALVQSGEAQCGPLILSALWLAAHRAELRAAALAGGAAPALPGRDAAAAPDA